MKKKFFMKTFLTVSTTLAIIGSFEAGKYYFGKANNKFEANKTKIEISDGEKVYASIKGKENIYSAENTTTAPTCTISADKTGPTNATQITYTITFSENVSGFTKEDLNFDGSNVNVVSFTGSDKTYKAVVDTQDNEIYTLKLSVDADVCQNSDGVKNVKSNIVSILVDRVKPLVGVLEEMDKVRVGNYIKQLYINVLGRTPKESEVDGHLFTYASTKRIEDVIYYIVASEEAIKDYPKSDYIKALYIGILNSDPDNDELTKWSRELTVNGMEKMMTAFCKESKVQKVFTDIKAETNQETAVKNYIKALYKNILGRDAKTEEITGCYTKYTSDKNLETITIQIASSAEARTKYKNEKYIKAMYKGILNRDSDTNGLNSWCDTLAKSGISETVKQFCKSLETIEKMANIEITDAEKAAVAEFIKKIYSDILGRVATTDEINKLLLEYKNNTDIKEIAKKIIVNEETQTKYASYKDYITAIYKGVLNRAPDDVGLKYWEEKFTKDGIEKSINSFCNSTEVVPKIEQFKFSVEEKESITNYIKRLYEKVFKRQANSSEINFHILEYQKNKDILKLTKNIVLSTEAKNKYKNDNDGYIKALYEGILGRAADNNGIKYWRAKIAEKGIDEVVNDFCNAEEVKIIFARLQNPTIESYMKRAYKTAMGKDITTKELNAYFKNYMQNKSLSNFVKSVLLSDVIKTKYKDNNSEYVKIIYKAVLNRDADKNGIEFWNKEIAANGIEKSLEKFCASDEVQALIINTKFPELDDYLKQLYTKVLGREYSKTEVISHLKLYNTNKDLVQLTKNIIGSKEAQNLYNKENCYIRAIYKAILNRKADTEGLERWSKYLTEKGIDNTLIEIYKQPEVITAFEKENQKINKANCICIDQNKEIKLMIAATDLRYNGTTLKDSDIHIYVNNTECTPTKKELSEPRVIRNGVGYILTLGGLTGNGELKITVSEGKVTDNVGNANVESILFPNIAINNTKPTVKKATISTANKYGYVKNEETVTLDIEFSEDINIKSKKPTVKIGGKVATKIEGSGSKFVAEYTIPKSELTLKEGELAIEISDYENMAGVVGDTVTKVTDDSKVIYDRTAPTVSSILPDGDTTWKKSQSVSISATDNFTESKDITGSYEWVLEGNSDIKYDSVFTNEAEITNRTGTGKYKVYLKVRDLAGNEATIDPTNEFYIDNSVTNPGSITIRKGKENGEVYKTYSKNGEDAIFYEGGYTLEKLYISKNDGEDNESGFKNTVYDVIQIKENEEIEIVKDYTQNYVIENNGNYKIIVKSMDNLGNIGTATYIIHKGASDVEFSPNGNSDYESKVTTKVTLTDSTNLDCRMYYQWVKEGENPKAFTEFIESGSEISLENVSGEYRLYIKIVDKDGNENIIESEIFKLSSEKNKDDIELGDIDANGEIDIVDLSKLVRHISSQVILSEDDMKRADINQDGVIDIIDLSKMIKIITEK